MTKELEVVTGCAGIVAVTRERVSDTVHYYIIQTHAKYPMVQSRSMVSLDINFTDNPPNYQYNDGDISRVTLPLDKGWEIVSKTHVKYAIHVVVSTVGIGYSTPEKTDYLWDAEGAGVGG